MTLLVEDVRKMASPRQRLDVLLVERGLCESTEQARRLVLAGEVRVDGHPAGKPGVRIDPDLSLELLEKPRYVGRGGLKLEGALAHFGINPTGRTCLDVGASTGGFTDCLLQHGAERVHAIDVGTNQLVWKIRSDPRVVCREKFNARHLRLEHLGEQVSLAVIDVSFISLLTILPPVVQVLEAGGEIVCLVKPQFEAERGEVGPGGIIRDDAIREKALHKVRDFVAAELGIEWIDHVDSSIAGMDGNREYLAWLQNR